MDVVEFGRNEYVIRVTNRLGQPKQIGVSSLPSISNQSFKILEKIGTIAFTSGNKTNQPTHQDLNC